MTIPKCKDLLNNKKLNEANLEELENAKTELENLEPDKDNEKDMKAKKNRLYRIDKEIKTRKENIGKEIKEGEKAQREHSENPDIDDIGISEMFNACEANIDENEMPVNEKDALVAKLNALNGLTGGGQKYHPDDFADVSEVEKVIASKTEKLMSKGDMLVPFAHDLFIGSNALIEVGGNIAKSYTGGNNPLDGYTNNLKGKSEMIKMCLRDMFNENPEILGYLSPTTRLGLVMLLAMGETCMSNKFRNSGDIPQNE